MKLHLSALLFVAAALLPLPATAEEPPAVGELIRRLGDSSFKKREAAERELLKREDAAPALRKALKNADPETARHIKAILEEFARRDDRRALKRLAAHAKKGEVDRAVELLVRRPGWGAEEDAAWQVFAEVAGKLLDAEKKEFGKIGIEKVAKPADPGGAGPPGPPGGAKALWEQRVWERQASLPFRDFVRYKKFSLPAFASVKPTEEDRRAVFAPVWNKEDSKKGVPPWPVTLTARNLVLSRFGHFVVRGHDVHAEQRCASSCFACTGRFRADDLIYLSGIFALGSVEVKGLNKSVVVCAGDVTVHQRMTDCIIVAGGKVTCPNVVGDCVIVAEGRVVIPKHAAEGNIIRENQAKPLGVVTFFDPSQAGITVETAEGGVRVKALAEGKPFARAGLKAGDVISALDSEAIKDSESFRRLLRRKLAEEKDAVFKVRRGEKTLEVSVRFKG